MTLRLRPWLIIVSLLFAISAGFFIACYSILHTHVVTADQGVKYKLRAGTSYKTLAQELHQQHIIKHQYIFILYMGFSGKIHRLKAGEYLFQKGTTPISLLNQVTDGTGLVYHSFTIVPGTTFRHIRTLLNKHESLAHTTRDLSDEEIMKRLGYPGLHPEGQFFPDTYSFVDGVSDLVILKRAFKEMQEKFNSAWAHRARDLPFKNPQEALIAASIIEKEADIDAERPIIAGVLVNRLRRNMLLQFDPTVIYGVGARFDGTIYRKDLLEDNPYNTYVRKGLPPTPISMPSMASIEAVVRPDRNNYIYFVARGDGRTHQFSRTLADHYAAVAAAKKYHPWFFNNALVKQYLLKSFSSTIFNTN